MTPKQQRFVDEYLIDPNAARAYTAAYGVTGPSAEAAGSRLLRNVKVAEAIRVAQLRRSERTGVTADRVVDELAVIGFSDPRHYATTKTGLALAEQAPEAAMRAVSSVKQWSKIGEDGNEVEAVEYRFWDKNAALEKLGKHLGMFVERHQHEVSVGDIRGRVAQTLDVVKRHSTAEQYATIVRELRPIWK